MNEIDSQLLAKTKGENTCNSHKKKLIHEHQHA